MIVRVRRLIVGVRRVVVGVRRVIVGSTHAFPVVDIDGLRQLVTGICRESKLITDCLLKATVNQMAAVNQTTAVNQVETMLPDPTTKLS